MLYAQKQKGFTIVELLIVIVVIAILAAITIVAYSGVQNRAKITGAKSDLIQAAKQLESLKFNNSSELYPATQAAASLKVSSGVELTYLYNSESNSYCAEALAANTTFSISSTNQTLIENSCSSNSMVGWWPLNGTANDASGNGQNGTVTNATLTAGQNGQANSAYSFNGSNTYIDLTDIDLPNVITMSVWVNPANITQGSKIFAKHGSSVNVQGTIGIVSAKPYFETTNDGSYTSTSAAAALSAGAWSLVTTVYDTTTARIYVNGALSGSTAKKGLLAANSFKWTIGSMPDSHSGVFTGSIDDVRIYNRALSAPEIQSLYAKGAQ